MTNRQDDITSRQDASSFLVVIGDFGCDVTCQACRFQASAGNSDSANRPGYEAGQDDRTSRQDDMTNRQGRHNK